MPESVNAVVSPVIVCPAPPLKSMVGALKALSDDAILVFSPEGITSKVVDSAHVCMLEVTIPNKTFTSNTSVQETMVAISLENFNTALKLAGKKDVIKMSLTDEDTFLELDIGEITKSVRLLDTSLVKNPPAPVLSFDLSYTLDADSLKKAITATKTVGDVVTFHFDGSNTKLTMDSKMERVEAPLETSNMTITSKEAVTTLYSVDYLVHMVKTLGSDVTISWGDMKPLKLISDDGAVTLSWLLAPRNQHS
jgi:DNA polymerase III sliding clamp (beta) subunit (PCNA family)|tara:strand:+ start:648 stop:1400 length:753 start_codon:yes stop_codon:yes gene_type:complete